MGKSARARARTSGASTAWKRQTQDASLDALEELHRLRDALLAQACLQNIVSLQWRQALDAFHVEPDELRALVTCVNSETQRRIVATGEAIESMRRALH